MIRKSLLSEVCLSQLIARLYDRSTKLLTYELAVGAYLIAMLSY